jgi:hypothetical protein
VIPSKTRKAPPAISALQQNLNYLQRLGEDQVLEQESE